MKYSVDVQGKFWHTYFKDRDKGGWTEVKLGTNALALENDILYEWITEHIGADDRWHGTGQYWLFKDAQSATLFTLRWL